MEQAIPFVCMAVLIGASVGIGFAVEVLDKRLRRWQRSCERKRLERERFRKVLSRFYHNKHGG